MTRREGYYEDIADAAQHISDTVKMHLEYQKEVLVNIEMNYRFGAVDKRKLEEFIALLGRHGFSNCDPFYIDEDEYAEDGKARFHWIPAKKLKFDGRLLFSEFDK